MPLVFLLAAEQGSYRLFWTLFGTSNQLLAALSLLAISVWLKKLGKPFWFTAIPMVLVFAVTLVSLALQIKFLLRAAVGTAPRINGLVSVILLVLAGLHVGFPARASKARSPT